MYWKKPSTLSGRRLAPYENSTSGTAVTTPVPMRKRARSGVASEKWFTGDAMSMPMYGTANGIISIVSSVMLENGLRCSSFLSAP